MQKNRHKKTISHKRNNLHILMARQRKLEDNLVDVDQGVVAVIKDNEDEDDAAADADDDGVDGDD